ncbi:MAG TPA: GldG family protein [Candidatus Binatia bacterium]|nr:GldG family protein [Candidatus Binatia bacterium]
MTAASQRLRIALAVPALLGIFVLGELLLDRRPVRLDLTPDARHTLSDQARRVLDALPADVRVIAFLRTEDPRNLRIEDLLRQVTARTPRVHVEVVDVNRSPALARQYGVDSYGALVVESDGRRRVFSSPSEEVFLAALLQVTRQQRKTIGWLVGHGEGDPAGTDRHHGYSTARRLLEQEYYDVRPVSLIGDEVPPETAVLVIAGPKRDPLPEELAALDRYLQRPGQALVLLDAARTPELARFLRRYWVDPGDDVVVDPAQRLYGGEYLTIQIPIERGDHPILEPLAAPPLFSLTRSVAVLPGEPGAMMGLAFLRSSAESWATRDPEAMRTGMARFVPGRDRRGPISVGVEVAFRVVTPPGAPPAQGRMVVYGNAEFADNFFIELLGNKDLFVNSVDWLAREPQAISHRPFALEPGRQQLFVSAEDTTAAFWGTAVVEPGLFALVGIALVARRRWG